MSDVDRATFRAWFAKYDAAEARQRTAIKAHQVIASALGITQRTGHLTAEQAQEAWATFSRLVDNDVQLLPVEPADFHRAAVLTLQAASPLRAGDALHLACAERAGAKAVATLDAVMVASTQRVKLKAVVFRAA